jgi:type I site-specific restriction endonuclease
MELAGKENASATIKRKTPLLIDKLKTVIEKLSEMEPQFKSDAEIVENTVLLKEKMKEIIAACEDFDSSKVDDIIKELEAFPWKSGTKQGFSEISQKVLFSDFDEAKELAENL